MIDNEVYMVAERPLVIKYTLTPYEDPQKAGIDYEDNIAVNGTMTVSAKTSFLGIKWSKLESKDIIAGSNGKIDIIDTKEPGTSIQEISAYFVDNRFFPGDTIQKEDIHVEGITIAGETVTIEDFDFTPTAFTEGKNEITVSYKNLSTEISYMADLPKLIGIEAEYTGDDLREGDTIEKEQFQVTGLYEDGQQLPLEDFSLEPSTAEESGELDINIGAEGVSTAVTVSVKKKEYAFTVASELHKPNSSYDPNVSVSTWEEGTDYSVDGKTYKEGIKLRFDNWMSGLMGNGTDFAENVESNLYIAVNQDALLKLPEEERYWDGHFVIGGETSGSPTTATISIFVDGKELYQSGEITSASTDIEPFHIAATGVEQILIQTNAKVSGNDFIIGIITEDK